MSRAMNGSDADRIKACGALLSDIADKAATIGQLSVLCVDSIGGGSDAATAMACACRDLSAVIGMLSDEGLRVCADVPHRGPPIEWIGSPVTIDCLEAASGVDRDGKATKANHREGSQA